MEALHEQRCYNHAMREAVARCPECGRFYCRECVTEHQERLICAQCLGVITTHHEKRTPWLATLFRLGALCCAVFIVWFSFYLMGVGLAAIPSEFHDGAYANAGYLAGDSDSATPEEE